MMLEVQGLSKSFGGLQAVAQVSLAVPQEQIVSLIGPNGAGKTTLFAMVAGFLKPDAGEVRLSGKLVSGLKPHQVCDLGMVRTFQITQPFAKLSIRENIMIGAYHHTDQPRRAAERAEAVASQVGMKMNLDAPADDLTVAGRKRLELARALATQPKLLLLDEVMAGLNPSEVEEILKIIRGIRDSGVTIFLIEHVMQAVMSLSDYTYVLNNGQLIASGTPEQVAKDPHVVEAYLGHGAAARLTGGDRRA
jgi:branched-chain amino acid transport system ATP-binding protein